MRHPRHASRLKASLAMSRGTHVFDPRPPLCSDGSKTNGITTEYRERNGEPVVGTAQFRHAKKEDNHLILTGAQIRAARALLGWRRAELATAANLHRNAVAYWERRATIPSGHYREPHACRGIREALLAAGVEMFMTPTPGVRLVQGHNNAAVRTGAHARVMGC